MEPFGFGTTTMPEHQLVGLVTGEMTPCFSMFPSSILTFGINGCPIFFGAWMDKHPLVLFPGKRSALGTRL